MSSQMLAPLKRALFIPSISGLRSCSPAFSRLCTVAAASFTSSSPNVPLR